MSRSDGSVRGKFYFATVHPKGTVLNIDRERLVSRAAVGRVWKQNPRVNMDARKVLMHRDVIDVSTIKVWCHPRVGNGDVEKGNHSAILI